MAKQENLFALRKLPSKRKSIEEQFEDAGLPSYSAEYRFAVVIGRQWRFDFAFLEHKVAVEVDGATFGRVIKGADGKNYRIGGYHNTGKGLENDAEKATQAQLQGWLVIKVTTRQIRDNEVIEPIRRALMSRGWRSSESTRLAL